MTLMDVRRRALMGAAQEELAPGIYKVQSIRTYGTHYVNMGITGYFKFVVDAQIVSTKYGCFCGRYGDSSNRFAMRKTGNTWGFALGSSSQYVEIGAADTERHIFTLDPFNKICSVDDMEETIERSWGTNSRTAYFGAYHSSKIESPSDVIGYGINVYNSDGTVRHELIPALNTLTWKEGFWHIDNVAGSAYFSALTAI